MHSTSNFNRLGDFQVDIENLFDHFFGNQSNSTATASSQAKLTPRADVIETEKGYALVMELPGVKVDDVSIEMKENQLAVSGSKKIAELQEGQRVAKSERRAGEFSRTFEFSSRVDADAISASFTDGLLTIRLPKCEKAMPRKIKIDSV